ncbi:hypothetical protein CCACVL1_05400 [Corchorus capsularis]|uniref:Uncharacterized protein n=1 Tax=Corchorus capsularis TaxID=210143 RepID=A0A1R3JKU1_COCAP|nr:hypothetical protein CCACVL1_05400 [Corchorus capsularis]
MGTIKSPKGATPADETINQLEA